MVEVKNQTGFSTSGMIRRRQLVPALVLLVCLAGYFSVSTQLLKDDSDLVLHLTTELSALNAMDPSSAGSLGPWLVQIRQLIPSIVLYDDPAAAALATPLEHLADKIRNAELVKPADQLSLRRELVLAEIALRSEQQRLHDAHVRQSAYFYVSVLAFVLLVLGALLRSRESSLAEPLRVLVRDQYLFSHAPVGVSLSDRDDRLIRINSGFEKVTGFNADELIGRPACEREPEGMRDALLRSGSWTGEYTMRRKDGSTVAEKVTRVAIGDDLDRPDGYLTISMDPVVSDDERQLMLWQAHHDSLTKLPNSNLLHERLVRALTTVQHEEKPGALISIDIDGFQRVNDSVGHEIADRILTEAAYRIAMSARESDTVARTGGDNFVIAMFEIDSVDEAERTAREAVESMNTPFYSEDRELFLSASAGLTIFPQDGLDRGELLQKADAACIQAKKRGGNQIAFFEEKMNSDAARRLEIETNLRRAIDNDELELHYQPIIDCATELVYGAEALLRWQSETLGFVSPGEFIPIAERCGLIVELGEWVVKEVATQLQSWAAIADWPALRVSLNVSARQFAVVEQAQSLLDVLQNAPTELLTVELTESALVANDPGASLFLTGLKEQGLRVALDDFGTGFSSISYLRDFEFDVLKIDKSFIDGVESSKEMGVIASIIAMGRILGMKIVAEGVETAGQVETLKRIGCDYIQGYYFCRPLPSAEFEAFVLQR